MSLLDILLLMALSYWLAHKFRVNAESKFQQELDSLEKDVERIKKIYKKVTVERHGDMLYIWEHGTDQFLFQGRTAKDFEDRVPNDMLLSIVDGDPEGIKQFKQLFPREESK